MKFSLLALGALVAASSVEAFAPPSQPRCFVQATNIHMMNQNDDERENPIVNLQSAYSRQALSFAAGALLSASVFMAPDVSLAATAAPPAKTAVPTTMSITVPKQDPLANEKKAVETAKSLVSAAQAKVAAAQKDVAVAKKADDAAYKVLDKAETAALKVKTDFIKANDKLSADKGNAKVSDQQIEAEKQKVGKLY